MRHIKQPNKTSCGVACLVMLAGISFRTSMFVLFGSDQQRKNYRVPLVRIKDALADLGCEPSSELIFLQGSIGDHGSKTGVIQCLVEPENFLRSKRHYVVLNNGMIHDPTMMTGIPVSECNLHLHSFLEVHKPNRLV